MPPMHVHRPATALPALAVAAVLLAPVPCTAASVPESGANLVLCDFDGNGAAQVTNVTRGTVREAETPPGPFAPDHGPAGTAAWVTAEEGAVVALTGVPEDWRNVRSVGFSVYRAPEEVEAHPTTTLEVRVVQPDNRAWHWRKVELSHVGWAEIVLPLRWFRWSDGRTPSLAEVEHLALYFRTPGTVVVDNLYLVEGDPGAALLTLDDLAPVAFPGAPEDQLARRETESVRLLTDEPALDTDQLATHLGEVDARIRADLPFLAQPDAPPMMLVFASTGGYRTFHPRFGAMLNSDLAPPRSSGFTVLGIATSTWEDRFGTLRPVYAHEYVHAVLAASAGLPNHGEWFQEGMASRYQLQFHPQANLGQIVADGIADPDMHLPLKKLCSGKPIPENRYWQAATVIQLLLARKDYRSKLPDLLEAFRQARTTDLGPALGSILGTDWETLEADWLAFCREHYGIEE